MKKALVFAFNDKFFPGFKVTLKSFLKHNPDYDGDIIILDFNLSNEIRMKCLEIYPTLTFKLINYDLYKMDQSKVESQFTDTVYKLDMFSLYKYDRIVFLDVDTLVIKPIYELWELDFPIAACLDFKAKGGKLFEKRINSGVLAFGGECLKPEVYKELIKYTVNNFAANLPDQQPINDFFGSKMYILPNKYNYFKAMYAHKRFKEKFDEAKIIHFYIKKPWQKEHKEEWCYPKIKPLYDLWNSYI